MRTAIWAQQLEPTAHKPRSTRNRMARVLAWRDQQPPVNTVRGGHNSHIATLYAKEKGSHPAHDWSSLSPYCSSRNPELEHKGADTRSFAVVLLALMLFVAKIGGKILLAVGTSAQRDVS